MNKNISFTVRDFSYIAICTSLIAICAWIKIPFAVPFTLQTYGIALAVALLGGKRALLSVTLYILLGAIGLPIFSGFTGGIGILLGSAGGYILGFLFLPLSAILFERRNVTSDRRLALGLAIGQVLCYTLGTLWYLLLYTEAINENSTLGILSICVLPFILPDALKLFLALITAKRLKSHIK